MLGEAAGLQGLLEGAYASERKIIGMRLRTPVGVLVEHLVHVMVQEQLEPGLLTADSC